MKGDFMFWACRALAAVGASTTSARIAHVLPGGDRAFDKLGTQI